jgi:ATP synthase protein I
MHFRALPRPIRIVLKWQLIATAGLTLVAAIPWGMNGAISAALGGAVNIVAGGVYGWRAAQGEARTAGEALRTIFRAEAIKIVLIFAGLWLVLASYKDIVHAAFFASFVVTVAVFAAAVAVRDIDGQKTPRPAGDE